MSMDSTQESLLDLFIFETSQNIEQLEQIILDNEKTSEFTDEAINEIFRIMHTIKGSAAMMSFDNMSAAAHSVEDLFYFIREHSADSIDYNGVPDLVFESLDFIRDELEKVKTGAPSDGDEASIVSKILEYLTQKKDQYQTNAPISTGAKVETEEIASARPKEEPSEGRQYKARIFFQEECQMESLRAFDVVNRLSAFAAIGGYTPDDIKDSDNSASIIRERGFEVSFTTDRSYEEVHHFFSEILFLREMELKEARETEPKAKDKPAKVVKDNDKPDQKKNETATIPAAADSHNAPAAAIINVNVGKLDKLMDLVGEMVISEAMVVENPDLQGLELDNFKKAARQLHKITTELQDTVMSIRMVPLADIFQKMHRIVRDMSKKLDKEIKLEIIGEETEADKNIIKHLSDPLMHLVRNCIDHGIEETAQRIAQNKPAVGTITLEARNAGNDVLVIVRDDGGGLDKEKILAKARANGLLKKDEADMLDKEIFNLIFIPGFSTNDNVTEYSGRGVGMDVVTSNIEEVGGSVSIESKPGVGTTITIKIPLTLAIIDGMNIRVGNACYTVPTISIKESFRPKKKDFITDPDGNEMVMVRGQCFAILRLHESLHVETSVTDFTEGIFIMIEQYEETVCIFADELIGQKQVVVKALPNYIRGTCKMNGLAGCTLLGDGGISLILDVGWLVGSKK